MAREREGFNHKAVLIFSIIQMTCGTIGMVDGVIQIFLHTMYSRAGLGIWCGLLFIVAGILGILAWKYKSTCNIIGLMVLSIIAAVFAFQSLVFPLVGLVVSDFYVTHNHVGLVFMDVMLILASLMEFVVSIVCASYCCKAVCCRQPSPAGQMVIYAPVQPGQPIMMPTAGFAGTAQMQQMAFVPGQNFTSVLNPNAVPMQASMQYAPGPAPQNMYVVTSNQTVAPPTNAEATSGGALHNDETRGGFGYSKLEEA